MTFTNPNQNNITWHNSHVTKAHREMLHGHKGMVVWFTGLSASGKSTIAHHLEKILHETGHSTYVFDGDNVRHGLCSDLGFSKNDRIENIRRIGEIVNLFIDAGTIAITAFISPYARDRQRVQEIVGTENYIEVFVDCPVATCIYRDPKGIYKKAMTGEIDNFTGISAPYEKPETPDIIIRSDKMNHQDAAEWVYRLMKERILLRHPQPPENKQL